MEDEKTKSSHEAEDGDISSGRTGNEGEELNEAVNAGQAEGKASEDDSCENKADKDGEENKDQETSGEKHDLEKDPEKYRKLSEEYKDKYTRLYAEFDNFRKRTDREKSGMYDNGARYVIEKLLPVTDNFERAFQSLTDEEKENSFTKGIEGIYKQLGKVLTDLGVEPIEALGQKFDPNFHNAVMTDTESDCEEDTVTMDLQKGYTYRGTVVRHSMVKVKKNP